MPPADEKHARRDRGFHLLHADLPGWPANARCARSASVGIRTKQKLQCRADRFEYNPRQVSQSTTARSESAVKSFDPRTTGRYQGHGRNFPATPERVSEELSCSAGAILHRQERIRGKGLQDGVDRAECCAPTEQGAILQSRVASDHPVSVLSERSASA